MHRWRPGDGRYLRVGLSRRRDAAAAAPAAIARRTKFNAALDTLSGDEREMVELVGGWVDTRVAPVVRDIEHRGEYPGDLIDDMKGMGVYGLLVPAEWGRGGSVGPVLRVGHRGAGPGGG